MVKPQNEADVAYQVISNCLVETAHLDDDFNVDHVIEFVNSWVYGTDGIIELGIQTSPHPEPVSFPALPTQGCDQFDLMYEEKGVDIDCTREYAGTESTYKASGFYSVDNPMPDSSVPQRIEQIRTCSQDHKAPRSMPQSPLKRALDVLTVFVSDRALAFCKVPGNDCIHIHAEKAWASIPTLEKYKVNQTARTV